ncbi:8020_t:CDS:2 [Acaulospora morrowiae]|uniref:8020_t:CDS:1 n=1 Tax=Acaulospora morrowiae TaxID=94023 RepID=A0A9N9EZC6_9GLOM|nr:8020_t:CDS:2 [Acaulospora morrowiae]
MKLSSLLILLTYFLNVPNSLSTSSRFARWTHASALVGDKLYFICGMIDLKSVIGTRDLFYLDLSKNFKDSLPIIEISSNLLVVNSEPYVLNEARDDIDFVFTFSTHNNTWQRPSIYGTPPTSNPLAAIYSVVDKAGKIYLFGGDNRIIAFSKIFILDTIKLSWLSSSNAGLPFNKTNYAGVLLNTGEILYIGGVENFHSDKVSDINKILVYDTKSSEWSMTTVDGSIIDSRVHHTAILALVDDKLYFMCGMPDSKYDVGTRDLFYLDLSKNFKGSLPIIEISSNLPVEVRWSTASVYGSSIFMSGGWLAYVSNGTRDSIDFIFTFSTKNNTWQRPSIYGTPPASNPLAATYSIIDKAGKLYLFGGDNRVIAYSVLLNNGEILYIGGKENYQTGKVADINKILVYDTKSSEWSTTIVGGSIIDSRIHHTAILGATIRYLSLSNEIYLFNIRKNAWTTEFISNSVPATTGDPTTTASVSTSTTASSNPQSITVIIAISASVTIGAMVLIALVVFLAYRYYKKRKLSNVIRVL